MDFGEPVWSGCGGGGKARLLMGAALVEVGVPVSVDLILDQNRLNFKKLAQLVIRLKPWQVLLKKQLRV